MMKKKKKVNRSRLEEKAPSGKNTEKKRSPEDYTLAVDDRVTRAMGYGRGTERMVWIVGQTYWGRILPVASTVIDHPLVVPDVGTCSYPVHRNLPVVDEQGEVFMNRPLFCLDNNRDNRRCPVCEYSTILAASGQTSDVVDSKLLQREAHHMVNLLIRGPQPKIYRVKFGVTIFKALVVMAHDAGDLTDPNEGIDLQFSVGTFGQFTYPKLGGLTRQKKIGKNIPWKKAEPITKSLNFVKKYTSSKLIKLLVARYGPIEGHPLFGQ